MRKNNFTTEEFKKLFFITSILVCLLLQGITPIAHATLSGWSVTSSNSSFSSNPPTWNVTVSTTDYASPLIAGDVATFLIEDQSGQTLGSSAVEISTDTTQVTFNIELDPEATATDLADTDFVGTFIVTHLQEDDELIELPLTREGQTLEWSLTSNNLSTATKPYLWKLEFSGANSDTYLNAKDTAELFISDADSNELADEILTVTKDNTNNLKFQISIDPSTMTGGWSADSLDGLLIIETSSGNQEVIELTIPISGLPNRPPNADSYIKKAPDYSVTPYVFQPNTCVDIGLSTLVNDPYHELSNILYILSDSSGNTITQGVADPSGNNFATDLYVCPADINNLTSPFTLSLGLVFDASDREYTEISNAFTWQYFVKAAPKAVATAKPKPVKITCVRAKPYSKITTTKAKCPTGYKKKV